jgi:hypothetical protein
MAWDIYMTSQVGEFLDSTKEDDHDSYIGMTTRS